LEGQKIRKFPPIPKERVVGLMNNIKPSKLGDGEKEIVQMFKWKKKVGRKKNHPSITKEKDVERINK
jgi:hypothetical protein